MLYVNCFIHRLPTATTSSASVPSIKWARANTRPSRLPCAPRRTRRTWMHLHPPSPSCRRASGLRCTPLPARAPASRSAVWPAAPHRSGCALSEAILSWWPIQSRAVNIHTRWRSTTSRRSHRSHRCSWRLAQWAYAISATIVCRWATLTATRPAASDWWHEVPYSIALIVLYTRYSTVQYSTVLVHTQMLSSLLYSNLIQSNPIQS